MPVICGFCFNSPVLARYEPPGLNLVVVDGVVGNPRRRGRAAQFVLPTSKPVNTPGLPAGQRKIAWRDKSPDDALDVTSERHVTFWRARP